MPVDLLIIVRYDFFSVFIGYKGFNDFVLNHKVSDSFEYVKMEVVEKTILCLDLYTFV